MRQALYAAGMLIALVSIATSAHAGTIRAVPEINGSSLSAGLGLLAGAVLIVRSRLRK